MARVAPRALQGCQEQGSEEAGSVPPFRLSGAHEEADPAELLGEATWLGL